MNKKTNVNEFLKRNNAIFSYLKDDNDNKVGMIIAVPGKMGPKIGFAFFEESTLFIENKTYLPITKIGQSPSFMEKLSKFGICSDELINIPFEDNPICTSYDILPSHFYFNPSMINKVATLQLARQRANFREKDYYVSDMDEYQRVSSLVNTDDDFDSEGIWGRRMKYPGEYFTENILCVSPVKLRKQIKKFEYRALRYFKYIIPSYKR